MTHEREHMDNDIQHPIEFSNRIKDGETISILNIS